MKDRLTTLVLTMAVATAMLGISALQRVQAEEHDSNAEHCLRLSSIDRTRSWNSADGVLRSTWMPASAA